MIVKIVSVASIIKESVKIFDGEKYYVATGDLSDDLKGDMALVKFNNRPSRADLTAKKGDVILARMKSTIKVLCITEKESDMIFSTGFIILRPNENINQRYLYHYLNSECFQSKKDKLCTGATQKSINNQKFGELEILLPSLDKQKRIVSILDKADTLRYKDQELLKKYDQLSQSIFVDMFGNPAKNEKNWVVSKFGDVVEFPSGLVDPRIPPYSNMFHVGGDNIESFTGKIFGLKKASELALKSGKFYFTDSHILYNKIRPYLNKVAIPNFEGICSADMYPLLPKEEYILKEYLYFILKSDSFLDFADKQSRRANIPKINMNEMSLFEFPIPPLKHQIEFAKRICQLRKISQNVNEVSIKSSELFDSLIQKAFKGELVKE